MGRGPLTPEGGIKKNHEHTNNTFVNSWSKKLPSKNYRLLNHILWLYPFIKLSRSYVAKVYGFFF